MISLPPLLTTTLLMPNYNSFFYHVQLSRKITRPNKRPKTQLENTEQTLGSAVAGVLELSGWNLKQL